MKRRNKFESYKNSPIVPYLTNPKDAVRILTWLHATMDFQDSYKLKMMHFRALMKNNCFIHYVPYRCFKKEFGDIGQQNYSHWAGPTNYYDDTELDNLYKSYLSS